MVIRSPEISAQGACATSGSQSRSLRGSSVAYQPATARAGRTARGQRPPTRTPDQHRRSRPRPRPRPSRPRGRGANGRHRCQQGGERWRPTRRAPGGTGQGECGGACARSHSVPDQQSATISLHPLPPPRLVHQALVGLAPGAALGHDRRHVRVAGAAARSGRRPARRRRSPGGAESGLATSPSPRREFTDATLIVTLVTLGHRRDSMYLSANWSGTG